MVGDRIASSEDLADAYPNPVSPASLFKEIDHVDENYAALISASPFVVLATVGPEGWIAPRVGTRPVLSRFGIPKLCCCRIAEATIGSILLETFCPITALECFS